MREAGERLAGSISTPSLPPQDPSLLNSRVLLHHAKAGTIIARQGDQVRLTLDLCYQISPLVASMIL